ncbi:major capsid protein [Clostridium magnum]|uniref:Phage major capsid protein E n=1 Tax=Clostridium magnum DSM 2767 TaxID=1121326 RepID=A0A161WQ30_9CLOT|nr:major capsid protein [Clostridium magnum]KZL88708.1 phage major capsid protein E [Clostridium magnum DSM 2767]SHJ44335.1 Phage major capsid protein E [Clostridium magnum DSM 2767]
MPNTINLYETTTMLEAIKLVKEPLSFIRDTFFPNIQPFPTEKVLVDIVKGGEKMAPFVAPRINGTIDERQGYSTNELTTPRIAPKRILTGEDLAKRQPGDNIYTVKSPEQIAAQILMQDLIDLDKQIIRSEEWFSTKVMLGEGFDIDLVDEKGNKAGTFNVNYGFSNKVSLQTGEKWSEEIANPIENVEDWIEDKIITKSNGTPNVVIMDPEAAKAFMANPAVKEIISLRAQAGYRQEPTYKGKGVTFIGVFTKFNLEFYAYSCLIKTGETAAQLLPSGTVIVAETGQGVMAYGAVTQKEKGTWMKYMEKRVPKYVVSDETETDTIKLTSRPLPYQKDVDSYVVASVL